MGEAPLRVAHVVWRLGREGGVQVVVRTLASSLDPAVVEMHVITARPSVEGDHVDEVPVAVHPVGYAGGPLRPIDRARIAGSIAAAVRRVRPDVIHLHSGTVWLGVLAVLVNPRAAVVLEVHDAPGSRRHDRRTDRIEGRCLTAVRGRVVCHSSSVRSEVLAHWRVAPNRVSTFGLAVDHQVFSPDVDGRARAAWRREHGVGAASVMGIVVGRLVGPKRIDLLLAAMARAQSRLGDAVTLELAVVGLGQAEPALRAEAERLGLADVVHFVGAQPGPRLVDAYRAADLCCSTSAYEGFGLTLVEAMSCGVPVVAMRVGGVGDVVADGVTGRLVAPGDVSAFAQSWAELADDATARVALGVAARRRVIDRFTADAMAERFVAVYREARRRPGRARQWARRGAQRLSRRP